MTETTQEAVSETSSGSDSQNTGRQESGGRSRRGQRPNVATAVHAVAAATTTVTSFWNALSKSTV